MRGGLYQNLGGRGAWVSFSRVENNIKIVDSGRVNVQDLGGRSYSRYENRCFPAECRVFTTYQQSHGVEFGECSPKIMKRIASQQARNISITAVYRVDGAATAEDKRSTSRLLAYRSGRLAMC